MVAIITELISGMTQEALKKLNSQPGHEEIQRMARLSAEFLDLSARMLRDSPELRRAFARAHSEFLKYPECAETIRQAEQAVKEFGFNEDIKKPPCRAVPP